MDLEKRYAEVGVPLGEKADEDKLPYIHKVEGEVPYTSKHRVAGPEVDDPKQALHSPIYEISEVVHKERPYTWWGPDPDEARALKVKENKFLYDKTTTLSDAVKKFIRPRMNIGIAGFVNTRNPFAICWQIVKEALCNKTVQATDLTLSFQSQSLDVEWPKDDKLKKNLKELQVDHERMAASQVEYWNIAGQTLINRVFGNT